ncbi:MAG: HAD family phosphatase [Clostridia bacterium]|nr:HAD family phosphatase [Clostridia bacterium]
MGKFDGILICTDLDGTLLCENKNVSLENLEAIEYFKKEGGYFTFVTGRMPFFVSEIYEVVQPNAPFGCINGGGMFDHRTQQYVWTHEAPSKILQLAAYAGREMPAVGVQVNCFDRIFFCQENEVMVGFREVTGVPDLPGRYEDIHEPIAKIVFGVETEEEMQRLQTILANHPQAGEFDFIRSEKTLFEILPKGINKGSVLPRLASYLGISPAKTIAVGDYDNDISMLRAAGVGYAVANACPAAKQAADRITVSNEEHAIAAIVAELENGNCFS